MSDRLTLEGSTSLSGAWPTIYLAYGSMIPKYPSWQLVTPAVVPAAQTIDLVPDMSVHAPHLWELYKTACRPPSSMTSAQAMRDRVKLLSGAAALLAMHEIAPAAWVAFSRSLWPEARKVWNGPEHPTASWMFGANRIQDQKDWFLSEQGSWCSARTKYGTAALHLAMVWASMKNNLVRAKPETEDQVRTVVERFFPGTMYESQLALARTEHREMQQRIDDAVRRGVFMWE